MKLSVIIPVYNTAESLAILLSGLLYQRSKHDDAEIIVIDDGSTEKMDWLDRVGIDVVIHKTNGGTASAKNAGLDLAMGEFVAFVDSDDAVADDFIEKILGFISAHPETDIQYFKCTCEDGTIGYHEACAWGKIVRREYIGSARFDENFNIGEEDTLFLPLAKKKAPSIRYWPETLYHYRWSANPDSLMKRFWRGEISKQKGL